MPTNKMLELNMIRALLIFSVILTSGCAPIPHFEKAQGKVSGAVYLYGQPVSGALVKSCKEQRGQTCMAWNEAATDVNGQFSFSPERRFQWLVHLIGERLISYSLLISHEGKEYKAWEWGEVGTPKDHTSLKCELSTQNQFGTNCSAR